jgi:hypothetical protein
MRLIYPLAVGISALLLTGCAGRFPLVGLDKNAKPVTARVLEGRYEHHLADAMVSIQESVLPALDSQETETQKWKLRTAVVGLGVKGELGFGPIKIGVRPRFRAAFANGEKPPIP